MEYAVAGSRQVTVLQLACGVSDRGNDVAGSCACREKRFVCIKGDDLYKT